MNLIGFNVEGNDLGGRRSYIRENLQKLKANWHLCLGDIDLAYSLLAHTSKGVIYRIYDPFNERSEGDKDFDNSFWKRHSPQSVIDYLKATHGNHLNNDKLVWSVGNNEPGTVGSTPQFIQWCINLMHLGKENNIRFARS